jgi:uncharacterized protein YfaP (DUF2135 family)
MKTHIISRIGCLAIAGLCVALSACETTGDPNQGGLFGWSESQAQDRVGQREAQLNAIEADTARQRNQAGYLEGRLDQAGRDANMVR